MALASTDAWVAPSAPDPGAPARVTRPWSAEELADAAVAALVAEAELTPKPGLVDARGGGAHRDMDLALLLASAAALHPTFARLADAARGRRPSCTLRAELGRIGRDGERTMLRATGGVNTHRGAIWALGLATAAAAGARTASWRPVLERAATLASFDDPHAAPAHTPGARARATYRTTGAIGEARAGFPRAAAALGAMRAARAAGSPETAARLDGLLAAMAGLEDTCLLARGGRRALRTARSGARTVQRRGGAATPAGRRALHELDTRLRLLGASPGGSADMLALALFLDQLFPERTPEDDLCRP